jgi:hypothetical protein
LPEIARPEQTMVDVEIRQGEPQISKSVLLTFVMAFAALAILVTVIQIVVPTQRDFAWSLIASGLVVILQDVYVWRQFFR